MKKICQNAYIKFLLLLICALGIAWQELRVLDGRWSECYAGAGELEGWLWRYWWMKEMLRGVWHSSATFAYSLWVTVIAGSYPETGNVFDLEVLSWPLEIIFGDPLYYNIKCLLVIALNFIGGYYLAKTVLKGSSGAWASGLVMSVSPFVLYEISNGRIRQGIIFPLAFYALHLVSLWRSPGIYNAIMTGIWAGISSAVYLYYGMAAGMFTAIYIGWCILFRTDGKVTFKKLSFGLLAFIFAFMGSAPFAGSYIDRQLRGEKLPELMWQRQFLTLHELTSPNIETVLKQNDPLLNSLQRFRSDSLPWQYAFMPKYSRCLPWIFSLTALAALPLAFVRRKIKDDEPLSETASFETRAPASESPDNASSALQEKSEKDSANDGESHEDAVDEGLTPGQICPWLISALFFYMLTLGPYFKDGYSGQYINYENGGIASPYIWFFTYFPAFSRLFSPIRMCGMMLVALGVLSAACMRRLFAVLSVPWVVRAMAALVIGAISLHSLEVCGAVPVTISRIEVPEYYYKLQKEPFCTVIELPFRTGDSLQYFQTVHMKKLLLGWSDGAFPPGFPECSASKYTKVFESVPTNSFLNYLELLNVHPDAEPKYSQEDFTYMVKTAGVKYIILHERGCAQIDPRNYEKNFYEESESLANILGPPVYIGEEYVHERNLETRQYSLAVFKTDKPVK